MAEPSTPNPTADQVALLAAIGHICLQWALLEQTILFIIGVIEMVPTHKAYTMFSGLDMVPRIGMAIQLAQEAKLPHRRFIRPLMDIRTELNSGLSNRRNMFVHGVHKIEDGQYILTMPRWKGEKRSQVVTLLDAGQLALEIAEQAQKADAIFQDYGVWKLGVQTEQNSNQQVVKTKAMLRVVRRQQIKRGLKLVFTNLKPW